MGCWWIDRIDFHQQLLGTYCASNFHISVNQLSRCRNSTQLSTRNIATIRRTKNHVEQHKWHKNRLLWWKPRCIQQIPNLHKCIKAEGLMDQTIKWTRTMGGTIRLVWSSSFSPFGGKKHTHPIKKRHQDWIIILFVHGFRAQKQTWIVLVFPCFGWGGLSQTNVSIQLTCLKQGILWLFGCLETGLMYHLQ